MLEHVATIKHEVIKQMLDYLFLRNKFENDEWKRILAPGPSSKARKLSVGLPQFGHGCESMGQLVFENSS